MQVVEQYETEEDLMINRLRLRAYLREMLVNQKRVMQKPLDEDYLRMFQEYYNLSNSQRVEELANTSETDI